MESKWLKDSLFAGFTANAFKLGTVLTLGWFWVRVTGGSILYRGSSMCNIDFDNILSVTDADSVQIGPPYYIQHNKGTVYYYVMRRVNGWGDQEYTLAAAAKVMIDCNGDLAQPQPNNICDVKAKCSCEGDNSIRLVWFYSPLEQKSKPVCFNIYCDGGTGLINYENTVAKISYAGRKFYSYQIGNFNSGTYLFAIRTESANSIENGSLAQLRIQIDTVVSNAINILIAKNV